MVSMGHITGVKQKVDILTETLWRIKFKEMRDLIRIQGVSNKDFKIKEVNVEVNLK